MNVEKDVFYRYIGMNGTIDSPIQLPGISSIKMYRLIADYQKRLTKDGKDYYSVSPLVPENELKEWYEV